MSEKNGPGVFFAKNSLAYALSLSGAATAVGIFAARARTSRSSRRFGWVLLSVLELAIFLGMIVVTEDARRSVHDHAELT